jgi:hypothetical protein
LSFYNIKGNKIEDIFEENPTQRKGLYTPECILTKRNMKSIDTLHDLNFYPRSMKFASTCDFFALYGDKKAAIFDMSDNDPTFIEPSYNISKDLPRFIVDL